MVTFKGAVSGFPLCLEIKWRISIGTAVFLLSCRSLHSAVHGVFVYVHHRSIHFSLSLTHSTHSPTASTKRKNVIVFSPRAHNNRAPGSREMSTSVAADRNWKQTEQNCRKWEFASDDIILLRHRRRRMEFGGIIYCAMFCTWDVKRRERERVYYFAHLEQQQEEIILTAPNVNLGAARKVDWSAFVEYAFREKSCLRIMFPATLTRRFIIHSAGWKFQCWKLENCGSQRLVFWEINAEQ